jgi:hypothetical protein
VLLVRVFGTDGLDRVGSVKVWSSGGLSMDMTQDFECMIIIVYF